MVDRIYHADVAGVFKRHGWANLTAPTPTAGLGISSLGTSPLGS